MKITRYIPGEHPVQISGFVNVFQPQQASAALDADRDQVASELGGQVDLVWADSHAAVFGLANVGDYGLNDAGTKAVNYLLKVRGQSFTYELKGPVLVMEQPDPAREVVHLVVDNTHLDTFTVFLDQYNAQAEEALEEAAEEHYQDWLSTREPGDQYIVSENDHSLDPIEPDFEVIQAEPGMFSHIYHLIFPSARAAMNFGVNWSQKRERLATPGSLDYLTEEEKQALTAARMRPNSLEAIAELRKLATPGFWQPSDQGILAVVSWDEDGETHTSSVLEPLSAQNQHYICRMHNVLPRFEVKLREASK